MWLILAATVGLAALVNARQKSSLNADLGPAQRFPGFQLRVPQQWIPSEDPSNPQALLEVHEPHFDQAARTLSVSVRQPSIVDVVEALIPAERNSIKRVEKLMIDGAEGMLVVRREAILFMPGASYYQTTVTASRPLGGGKTLELSLTGPSARASKREMERDVELVKRIAATIVVDAPAQ